ncbi:MAG: hypothetical protein JWP57_4481 [Spirosoma sp.]|nr:hypothetical protein [Spirosoma sp.]
MAAEDHKTGSYALVGTHNHVQGNTFSRSGNSFSIGYKDLAADTGMNISAAPGVAKNINLLSGTSARWIIGMDNSAESGTNVGGDFLFKSRADDGSALMTPLAITRSTGRVAFAYPIKVPALATASRPAAFTAGAGAHMFDSTLGKPIWSNGSVWVDATGATV